MLRGPILGRTGHFCVNSNIFAADQENCNQTGKTEINPSMVPGVDDNLYNATVKDIHFECKKLAKITEGPKWSNFHDHRCFN